MVLPRDLLVGLVYRKGLLAMTSNLELVFISLPLPRPLQKITPSSLLVLHRLTSGSRAV
jgi:hypothetical protein